MNQTITKNAAVAATFLVTLSLLSSVQAQTTWDGGGGNDNWTTGLNWDGDAAPANDGSAVAVFAGSTRLTPELDAAQDISQIVFGSGASSFDVGGSTLTLQSTSFSSSGSPIINNSSVLQTISADITMGASGGNSGIRTDGGDIALTGNLVNGTRKLILSGGNDLLISGNVSGAGFTGGTFLLNTGFTGVLTLSGSNTYTGNNEIRDGTLRVLSDNALGTGSADVVLNTSSATPSLLIGGAFTVGHNVLVDGTTANPITVGGDTADNSFYSGDIKLGNTAGRALTVTAASGGTVQFDGNVVTSVSGSDDADTVTKIGAGTAIFAGAANTYSGSTTVSAGTLLVNGAYTVAGQEVTVASGASFGGTGTVNRELSIADGAILIGGNGVAASGALTVGADVTMDDNSKIRLVLGGGGTHSTLTRTSGTWVFDGDQSFTINLASAGTYLGVITGLTGGETGLGSIATWSIDNPTYAGSVFSYDGFGNVDLSLVPEPASSLLIGLGLAGALFGRKRRQ